MKRMELEVTLSRERAWVLDAYSSLPPAVLDMPATVDQHDPSVWWTPKDHFAHHARVGLQVALMIRQAVFGDVDVSTLTDGERFAIADPATMAGLSTGEDIMVMAHRNTNAWWATLHDMTFDEVIAYGAKSHAGLLTLLASISDAQLEDTVVGLTKSSISALLATYEGHGHEHFGYSIEGLAERGLQPA